MSTKNNLYFYADKNEASLYDHTVRMSDKAYDFIHDNSVDILCSWYKKQFENRQLNSNRVWILNLGCGTGKEAISLLNRFSNFYLVCVDASESMISNFRLKVSEAYGDDTAFGRIFYAQVDFRNFDWIEEAITSCSELDRDILFNVAISVYSLHHLSPSIKKILYSSVFYRLATRSIFINADLIGSDCSWIDNYFQSEEERWIIEQFDSNSYKQVNNNNLLRFDPNELKDKWLNHIRYENNLLPAINVSNNEYKNSSYFYEKTLLHDAGFDMVEIVARWGQSAIFIAEKGYKND